MVAWWSQTIKISAMGTVCHLINSEQSSPAGRQIIFFIILLSVKHRNHSLEKSACRLYCPMGRGRGPLLLILLSIELHKCQLKSDFLVIPSTDPHIISTMVALHDLRCSSIALIYVNRKLLLTATGKVIL